MIKGFFKLTPQSSSKMNATGPWEGELDIAISEVLPIIGWVGLNVPFFLCERLSAV